MKNKKTGDFKSLGDFLVSARKFLTGELMDNRIKVMTEGTDSAGGVLVPEQWTDEILSVVLEESIVRPRAVIQPMESDTVNIPRLDESDRSSNLYGGITFTWLEEAASKATNAADPALAEIKLTAHEGVASCWVSNQLEDDVSKFGDYMKQILGKVVAFYEDDVFINGNGSGQPLGILNSHALISAARGAVNNINIIDMGTLSRRLLPGSWKNAVWLINQDILAQWIEMQSSAANSVSVIDLKEMKCLGAPIIVSEKCPALGTLGDIILADFSHYVIGDRELVLSASRDVPGYWQKNKTFWKLYIRVAGQPTFYSPITAYKGTYTLSAFVALTAAS